MTSIDDVDIISKLRILSLMLEVKIHDKLHILGKLWRLQSKGSLLPAIEPAAGQLAYLTGNSELIPMSKYNT